MAKYSKAKLQEELEGQLSAGAGENPSTRDQVIFGLLDTIDELGSEQAIKEYFRVNNAVISRMVENDEMPVLSEILHTEPDWGKEKSLDLKKMFGENALDKWHEIPWEDVVYAAKQNEIDPKLLYKEITRQAEAEQRRKIAHGEDLGGWFDSPESFAHNLGGAALSILSPRVQASIERGEDPKMADYALDAIQNALYTGVKLPGVGKMLSFVGSKSPVASKAMNSVGGKLVEGLGNNARNPVAMEILDDVAYDEENNPRSDLRVSDMLVGTGINATAPILTKMAGMKLARLNQGMGKRDRSVAEMLENWGEGETPNEIADKVHRKWVRDELDKRLESKLPGSLSQETWGNLSKEQFTVYQDKVLHGIATQPGKNFREKLAKYKAGLTEKEKATFQDYFPDEKELVALYRSSGYPATESAKSRTRLDLEKGSSDYIVNELGDNAYSDETSRIGMMIPFVREGLETLEEKQAKDDYERNKRKAYEMYTIKSLLGE